MCETCTVLSEKILLLELDLLRALHYIVVSQFDTECVIQLNSASAARNLRALSFLLVDKYIKNKKIVMERILDGLRIETIERSKIVGSHCWMMDEELHAIKEYMCQKGVTLLVYHDNDIKPYVDPFENVTECIVMIHCYKDIHFSGTRPLKSTKLIIDICRELQASYDINSDFVSFFNDNFEIISTSPDGNCGYHAIINSIIYTKIPEEMVDSVKDVRLY